MEKENNNSNNNSKKVNERILRITGGACIPDKLVIGHSYTIGTTIDIYGQDVRDQQDGTVNVIYKGKLFDEVVIDDRGEKKIAPVKGESFSKKWRNFVWASGEDYDEIMRKMLAHADEVLEFIKNFE